MGWLIALAWLGIMFSIILIGFLILRKEKQSEMENVQQQLYELTKLKESGCEDCKLYQKHLSDIAAKYEKESNV